MNVFAASRTLLCAFLCVSSALSAQSIFDSTRVAQRTEIYFASGKFELSPAALASIDSVANFFKTARASSKIRITAHTDSVGSFERNKSLSENRGEAVRNALQMRDIPAAHIQISTFGEKMPVAPNFTETGRQRNRRATLDVLTEIPMATYSGQIKDRETGKGISATLVFSSKTHSDSMRTDTAGFYALRLPKDSVIKMDVYAPGFFFKSQIAKIYGSPDMAKRMKNSADISLQPARTGETAAIQDMFFVGNQAVLLKTSEPVLPKILRFMEVNPNLKIEIAGHINHPVGVGTPLGKLEPWEFELSVNRAKLVYDFLLKNGISPDRLTYKGYGNTQMRFPNARTPEEMEENRRVEIRVL